MLGAMLFFVPLAMRNLFAAYALWGWTGVVSPNFYLYGFMGAVHYNLFFALLTLVLLFIKPRAATLDWTRTQALLAMFAVCCTVSALFSYQPNPSNWPYYENAIKNLVFCLLMPLVIVGRVRIQAFVVVIAIGLGFHAAVEGLKVLLTGGGHRVTGLPSTLMSDNNQFAVGMAMALPLCYWLYQVMERPVVRLAALGGMGLAALTIIGSNSRGGFLALSTVALALALASRRKVLTLCLIVVLGAALLMFAPESWFERMNTIKTAAEQDDSFLGRIVAWKISTVIALANPFVGGGVHAVQAQVVWDQFKGSIGFLDFIPTPEPSLIARAAHSIYFEILGDLGFIGFGVFLALLFNAFRTAADIRRIVGTHRQLIWARDVADALKVAVVAYAVGGAGVSMGYFELYFAIVALLEIIKQHVLKEAKAFTTDGGQSLVTEQKMGRPLVSAGGA